MRQNFSDPFSFPQMKSNSLLTCSSNLLIDPILAPTYYYFTHFPLLPWQSAGEKGEELLMVVLDTTVFPCKVMRGAEPVGAQGYF